MAPGSYRQKRKSTKVTKAILITTWLLIFALLGLGAWFIVGQSRELEEQNDLLIGEATAESPLNANVLTILTDSTGQNLLKFTVIKFNADQGKISVAALPDDMEATVKFKSDNLREQFEYGGPLQVKAAVENALSIVIDRYAVCPLTALEELIETLGGVEYTLDEDLYYKDAAGAILTDLKKGTQTLNGQQVVKFLRYPKWESLSDSANQQASLCAAIINQYANQTTVEKMPDIFGGIVNQLKTDISVMDILKLQGSYNSFVNAKAPATAVEISGTDTNGFKASEKALSDLKEAFK